MTNSDLLPGRITVQERLEIETLIADGAWKVDHGQADTVWEQCTQNAILYGMRPGEDVVGREAIKEWGRSRVAAKRTTRHVITNVRVFRDADGALRGTAAMTLYRHEGDPPGAATPFMIGDYEDRYEQGSDGCWLLAERRIVWVFLAN